MVAIKEWYRRVNEAWPKPLPKMAFAEGARAVRKLYRFVTGQTFTGEIIETSGNRFNYARRGVFYLNTQGYSGHGAWHDLIHDVSHTLVNRVWLDKIKPHSREHARLELRLVKEAVKRGWLTGALKDQPKPVKQERDARVATLIRTEALIAKWETKLKRAQTALKKLSRRKRYYERTVQRTSATVH